jgi:hypothetical protein
MPCLVFTCDRCDYVGLSTSFWGQFSYESGDQLMRVYRIAGWCNECGDFVSAEHFPTEREFQALDSRVRELTPIMVQQESDVLARRSWWQRLRHAAPVLSIKERELKERFAELVDDRDNARGVLDVLRGRRSGPRCLRCGSADWIEWRADVRPNGTYDRPGPPVAGGLRHPMCGGQLLVQYSGDRPHLRRRHRIYDREGRFLRDLHRPDIGRETVGIGESQLRDLVPDFLKRR